MENKINTINHSKEIVILEINNPPVNALSSDLLLELRDKLIKINKSKAIQVVIITSSLIHFSAGADLKERSIMDNKTVNNALDLFNDSFNLIERSTKITICALNGYVLGGGAELSLCCDFRLGSEDMIFGFPEVSIGIIPGAGGTQRLAKLIGIANAKYLIMTAEKINSKTALQFGLISNVCKRNKLIFESIKLSNKILSNAPIALINAKKAINSLYNTNIDYELKNERKYYNRTINTADRKEALNAFNEHRKPKWRNK